MSNSRHGRETEKQRIDIFNLLYSNRIIPSITTRATIGSIEDCRKYNREKGKYKKVNSKEIEVIPRVVEDRFELDHL
jgi:hypothetical protein